ncbi:MAG: hypothetical protein RSF00_04875, partial [Oscillospiraceae bacterium]
GQSPAVNGKGMTRRGNGMWSAAMAWRGVAPHSEVLHSNGKVTHDKASISKGEAWSRTARAKLCEG